MPDGKPAGVRCVQLLADFRCALFGRPERPAVCASLRPIEAMCGLSQADALAYLTRLEIATASRAHTNSVAERPDEKSFYRLG
jgi:hypothetical protein